jgi:hypothetical protein
MALDRKKEVFIVDQQGMPYEDIVAETVTTAMFVSGLNHVARGRTDLPD